MSSLTLDAEALYQDLLRGVRGLMQGHMQGKVQGQVQGQVHLAGITSGGAWLAERLHRDLGLAGQPGTISSAMHRDDFAQRGLSAGGQTKLPFDVDGARIVLLDDVLYTGRTIRAAINEMFDYGRPAGIQLAVLVDRGGRELPIEAAYAAARVALPPNQLLALARDAAGAFSFHVEDQ